jgi:predicted RNase H-like nuclease (RuvC/YqgF family)
MTENELKRVTIENRRLRDEAGASEKGIIESKEREIRNLTDKVRSLETEYEHLLQKEAKEKVRMDREIAQLQGKIDGLESDLRSSSRDRDSSSRCPFLSLSVSAGNLFLLDIRITKMSSSKNAM